VGLSEEEIIAAGAARDGAIFVLFYIFFTKLTSTLKGEFQYPFGGIR